MNRMMPHSLMDPPPSPLYKGHVLRQKVLQKLLCGLSSPEARSSNRGRCCSTVIPWQHTHDPLGPSGYKTRFYFTHCVPLDGGLSFPESVCLPESGRKGKGEIIYQILIKHYPFQTESILKGTERVLMSLLPKGAF